MRPYEGLPVDGHLSRFTSQSKRMSAIIKRILSDKRARKNARNELVDVSGEFAPWN